MPSVFFGLIAAKALFYLGALAGLVGLALFLFGVSSGWPVVIGTAVAAVALAALYGLSRIVPGRMEAITQRNLTTIYMPLVSQGTAVWRPVEAMKVGELGYMVTERVPADENWAFQPGQILRCEERSLDDGRHLVAVAKAT